MDAYADYDRFAYKEHSGGDLAPPHGVWDNAKKEWAEIGTFGTEAEARACVAGMNKAREICGKRPERVLAGLLYDLRRAVRSLEDITT